MQKAAFAAVGTALCACLLSADAAPQGVRRLSLDEYRDRMTAGWLGQMIGVEWGLPTEFRYQGTTIPDEKVPVWRPEMINHAFGNDDLFVEMTFLRTLETHGMDVSAWQAGLDFANTKYGLCAANWAGRDNLRRGIAPPDCGHPKYNACADCIDYQIESDYAGLISPGLPQRTIDLANVFGTLVNQGDGVWAGEFMGGLYAEAFFTQDINALLDAGLSCIPTESQYAGMVRDVRRWHREFPNDWRECWRRVKARYVDDPGYHRGRIDQPGSDVKPNGAFVVMGLLYGAGDLARTIRVSMQCGWDSDCNPSSAAGVLLTALGTNAIDGAYLSGLDRSRKFSHSPYDFDALLAVCERLARENVVKAGGSVEKDADGREWFVIPNMRPTPAACRPNWDPEPATGVRYSAEDMKRISEKPFPGIGETLRRRERLPPVPIGTGDKWMLGDHPEEYDKALVSFCFAPYNLENEELPIKIRGYTNTVIHLGWGKCHVGKRQTIFAFEDCDNVVLREGTVFFHAPAESNPPPLYTVANCRNVKVYDLFVREAPQPLPPLKVRGKNLVSGDRRIVLRGINWGWWHLQDTRYTENDMRRQAAWGANVLRLAISYGDVEDPARLGMLREEGVKDVDEVIGWAEKHGQYVILDMHVCPGGQSGTKYTDGGKGNLWGSAECRRRFLSLWRELAKRYRRRNALAAYELLNEPDTKRAEPDWLAALQREAVAEIRKVDPEKVIVVTGDRMSDAANVKDMIWIDDPNILYTFHFYDGGGSVGWLRNIGEKCGGECGTKDWHRFDLDIRLRPNETHFAVLLRSTANSGVAWFDDLELRDADGNLVEAHGFDAGAEGFSPECDPKAVSTYDGKVGHLRPGALRVSGTAAYNGWIGPRRKAKGTGSAYRLSGWLKLEKATGGSYAAAAVFGAGCEEDLRRVLKPAIDFQRRHDVPLYVGEFAVENASGRQAQDTALRIRLIEELGFSWTYWNYRETTDPGSMALHPMRRDGTDFPVNEALLTVLKGGWSKNSRP